MQYLSQELKETIQKASFIVFDYDLTMTNTRHVNFEAYRRLFVPYGIEITFEDYLAGAGGTPEDHCRIVVEKYNRGDIDVSVVAKGFEKETLHTTAEQGVELFSYVPEVLAQTNCPVFIVTGNTTSIVEASLKRWGIFDSIAAIFALNYSGAGKQNILNELYQKQDAKTSPLFFEDLLHFLNDAKRIGYVTCGVAVDSSKAQQLTNNCDFLVKAF